MLTADKTCLYLIGPMRIERAGTALALPASRKTRALLGYLALSPRPVSRQRLCELFFDIPDDPRAALRWSLTKLRPLLDQPGAPRLLADRDTVWLDRDHVTIDALTVQRLAQALPPTPHPPTIADPELMAALAGADGELLEDADLPDQPDFAAWLAAQRQQVRDARIRLLQARLHHHADNPAQCLALYQQWLTLAPLDAHLYAESAAALRRLSQPEEADAMLAIGQNALRQAGVPIPASLRPAPHSRPPALVPPASDPRPAIAVLPWRDLSPVPLAGWITGGLAEGVSHALSRFQSLAVIAWASSGMAHPPHDSQQLGATLGADLLVDASITQQAERLLVRWRLIACDRGRVVTSGDILGDLADIWAVQEQAAAHIASAIEPAAQDIALQHSLARPTSSCAAYDLYLQGLHAAFSLDRLDYRAGLAAFKAALALDANFAPAAAMAPWAAAYGNLIADAAERSAYAMMARAAARQGERDSRTLAMAATAVFFLDHDYHFGEQAVDRALSLNPNEYTAWLCGGWISVQLGRHDQAMERFHRAERLNPLAYGRDGIHAGRALCQFMVGDLAAAEQHVRLAMDSQPHHPAALITALAIAALRQDRPALETRRQIFLSLFPAGMDHPMITSLPFALEHQKRKYFEALEVALIQDKE